MSGTTMDIDGLKAVLAAGKAAPPGSIDMIGVMRVDDCGTTCCLIGNFCAAHPDDPLKLYVYYEHKDMRSFDVQIGGWKGSDAISERFHLPHADVHELFWDEAGHLTRDEALARLEQFIKDHE